MATLTLRPNAAGTYQEMGVFPSGSTHWGATSDQSDSSYLLANDILVRDFENFEDTSQTGTISSVTGYMRAKKLTSAQAGAAQIGWRIGGPADWYSVGKALTTNFADYSETRDVNPQTGLAWTWDDINALELGAMVSAFGRTQEGLYFSEFWIVVEYTVAVPQAFGDGLSWVVYAILTPIWVSLLKLIGFLRKLIMEVRI